MPVRRGSGDKITEEETRMVKTVNRRDSVMPVRRGPGDKITEEETRMVKTVNRGDSVMPVRRGPGDKITEEETRMVKTVNRGDSVMPVRRGPGDKITEEETRAVPAGHPSPAEKTEWDAPTELLGKERGGPAAVTPDPDTELVVGRRQQADAERLQGQAVVDSAMKDPVVGWLVVIAGPGKGRGLKLGSGSNSMGRGTTNRVILDFGDRQISQSNHATVNYDPRGRRFYLQHGSGKNLTYLNKQPVLAPVELKPLSHISLGDTVLRFVPFCDRDFSW